MASLNTSNPDFLTFKHEQLLFAVMGGIKLEGLDRLRVTLKIEIERKVVRHNLDLYNDTQLDKLIRKAAERLGVGVSFMNEAMLELVTELENYRIESLDRLVAEGNKKTKELTKEEENAAKKLLQSKNLLEKTNELIGQSGIVGEHDNRLLMFLIFTSRKMQRPLHVVSFGSSGAGKSHLQQKVAELIPEEEKIEITALTGNAFYYFERGALTNKLILIEDLDGAESALYPIRELQSKQSITKTLTHKNSNGQTKTVTLTVEGPVSIAGCTTQERIYEDNANRSFLIQIDESDAQDARVMNYQRALSANQIDAHAESEVRELLKNSQRLLQPLKVVNPYAEQLMLPGAVFKPRRTNAHYIQFIEAITFYSQWQRQQKTDPHTGEPYIETTLEDIAAANKLLAEVLLRKSDDLSGACRGYFEKLKLYLLGEDQKTFSNREISLKLRVSIATVKRHHLDLYNCGYLKIVNKDKLKGYEYEIVSYDEYKQLQQGVSTVLEEGLKNLSKGKRLSSSKAAQSNTEPLKSQKTRKKSPSAQ